MNLIKNKAAQLLQISARHSSDFSFLSNHPYADE